METNDTAGIAELEHLKDLMDNFCKNVYVPDVKFDSGISIVMDMDFDTLVSLEATDAFAHSYKLNSYCIFLRRELDKLIPQLNWCDTVLNRMVGRSWNDFHEYMKYEVRRQSAIEQDTFAKKVDEVRLVVSGYIQQIKEKIVFVQNMANSLDQIGRKKSYERS